MKSYVYFHDDFVDLLDHYGFDFDFGWRSDDAEKSEVARSVGAAVMALRQFAHDATMQILWRAAKGGACLSDMQQLSAIIHVDVAAKAREIAGDKDLAAILPDEAHKLARVVRDAAAAWAALHIEEALETAANSIRLVTEQRWSSEGPNEVQADWEA